MIKKIQQIGSNKGVAALACKLASAFFSFIFVLVVARLLSTDDAGVFLYSYTLMMILVQLSRAGTEHSLVKALSGQVTKIDTDVVIKKISIYVGLIALVLMIIIISFAYSGIMEIYTDKANLYTLYYFCATVLLFALCQILGSYFQTRLEVYSQYWAMNVGIVLLGSILVLTLLLFDKKISSLILSQSFFVINIVVLACCMLLYIKSKDKLPTTSNHSIDNLSSFIDLVKFTFPFSVLAFITISVQWGGQLLASLWLNNAALGLLSVCIRLGVLVNFIFLAFNALLAPKIAQLHQQSSEDKIYEATLLHTAISLIYSLVTTICFVLFGKQILGLFGSDYIAGYDSLLVLSIAWLIRVYIGPSDIILLMTGQVKASRRNLYIAAITSVVSACIFIPFLGVVGAILSMSVSGVLLSLLNHYVVVKLYGISYMGRKGLNDRIITLKGKLLLILKNHSKNTKTEINDG